MSPFLFIIAAGRSKLALSKGKSTNFDESDADWRGWALCYSLKWSLALKWSILALSSALSPAQRKTEKCKTKTRSFVTSR